MTLTDTIDPVEAGRSLGHDLYRLSRIALQPGLPQAVREGFEAAAALRGSRARQDDRFVRKWLQLRLGALARGRGMAPDVTVELLRRLDASHCPVTREPLTHATRLGSDASVDRLNNDGAYAAANLAVLMLGPAHAERPADVPALPLCAPLPPTSVRTALQQVQRLLTLNAGVAALRNRLLRGLLPACGSAQAEARLRLLADAVHVGLKRLGNGDECWDVWLRPGPMEALIAWREALGAGAWAHTSWAAAQLAGGHPVNRRELAPWQLATRGYLPQMPGAVAMPLR